MGGQMSNQTRSSQPATLEEATRHKDNIVVIPIDGSKQADMAFMWYVDHAHTPENKIHIVHGQEIEYPTGEYYPDYAIPPEEWEKIEKAIDVGRNVIKKYGNKLKELKIDGEVHSLIGSPGHVIVSSANNFKASMIVMGTRGMGLLSRSIFGSVSDYVIRNTSIPVTVVPDPDSPRFHNVNQE